MCINTIFAIIIVTYITNVIYVFIVYVSPLFSSEKHFTQQKFLINNNENLYIVIKLNKAVCGEYIFCLAPS